MTRGEMGGKHSFKNTLFYHVSIYLKLKGFTRDSILIAGNQFNKVTTGPLEINRSKHFSK